MDATAGGSRTVPKIAAAGNRYSAGARGQTVRPVVGPAWEALAAAARRPKKVGMGEPHAGAVAENLRNAVTGSVATKQDPDVAAAELPGEIAAVGVGTAAFKAGAKATMARGVPRRAGAHAGRADVRNPPAPTPASGRTSLPTSLFKAGTRLRSGRRTRTAPPGIIRGGTARMSAVGSAAPIAATEPVGAAYRANPATSGPRCRGPAATAPPPCPEAVRAAPRGPTGSSFARRTRPGRHIRAQY